MNSVLISQCSKSLSFSPLTPYSPLLPAYAIRHDGQLYLTCGFERESGEAIVLQGSVSEIFKSLYPTLSVSEMARLFAVLAPVFGDSAAIEIVPQYGHRITPETGPVLKMISALPLNFQNWMSIKSVGLREISFLSLIQAGELLPLLEAVSRSSCTKAQGVQLIETWCELRAMGRLPEKEIDLTKPESALKELLELRNPQTSKRDNDRGIQVKQLPWPAHTQAKWVRQGDQAGIEVKFQLHSVHDLDKQIQGLQHLRQNMADELWRLN